jgi:hypothetical protein
LNDIRGTASLNSAVIYATASGLFSKTADGWEDIKPETVSGLSVSGLSELLDETRERPSNALGKLVFGTKWYFTAIISKDDSENLKQGETASLLFGRYNARTLRMTVESISRAEDGKCVIVFSCDRYMADIVNMRQQEAELVFSEFTGLRVPKKCVHVDEDGKTCVYVQTALRAEKKTVEIAYVWVASMW